MQAHPCSVVFIALTLGSAVAGTSANYTTSPQAIDAGGQRAARSNYTADGSLGGVAGISAVIPPDAIAKQGYLAGTVPSDPASHFSLHIDPVPGAPQQNPWCSAPSRRDATTRS